MSLPSAFPIEPLAAYLAQAIPGCSGQPALERISGGQSNPTFFVTFPERRLVLRKQPAGPLLPSAHAIDREYRVITALAGTEVPVPKAKVLGSGIFRKSKILPSRTMSSNCSYNGCVLFRKKAKICSGLLQVSEALLIYSLWLR